MQDFAALLFIPATFKELASGGFIDLFSAEPGG
jgi:hypothetical protein